MKQEEAIQDTSSVNRKIVVPLEEWEMREPDPSFVAEELPEAQTKEEQQAYIDSFSNTIQDSLDKEGLESEKLQ